MRRLVTVAAAVLLAAALVPSVSASPLGAFHILKACPSVTGGNACDIVAADPFDVLVGGRVVYYDDALVLGNPAGYAFEDATIQLVSAGDAVLAVGHIHWRMTPDGTFLGMYTINGGSGPLAGLHAIGAVTDAGPSGDRELYALDGTYHVTR
jgi:hypothetical protein